MGPNHLSSVPFWRRINRLRNKNPIKNIANIEENGMKFTNDHAKAQILADLLKKYSMKTQIITSTVNTLTT